MVAKPKKETMHRMRSRKEGARSGSGRWHGLPMHARNRIAVTRGFAEGHPAARLGASVRALLDHF